MKSVRLANQIFVNRAKLRENIMDLSDKCPITTQIDNIDDTIAELNQRIGELIHETDEKQDLI
jgi:translation elongation factor EF-G